MKTVSIRPFGRGRGLSKNFGLLDGGGTIVRIAAEVLGLQVNELAILRFRLLDDLKVSLLSDPEGEVREGDWIGLTAPPNHPTTQFWSWGSDQRMAFVLKNPTTYQHIVNRIVFVGWLVRVHRTECPGGAEATLIRLGWE